MPFKKGDILTVLVKEEENWWRVRDCRGCEGMIPKPYVIPVRELLVDKFIEKARLFFINFCDLQSIFSKD